VVCGYKTDFKGHSLEPTKLIRYKEERMTRKSRGGEAKNPRHFGTRKDFTSKLTRRRGKKRHARKKKESHQRSIE